MRSLWMSLFFFAAFTPHAMADSAACALEAQSLPDPGRLAGDPDPRIPIEHIIVIMQENHSFDNYFGRLGQAQYYGSEIDGTDPTRSNPGKEGKQVFAYHESTLCVADPEHGWDAIHREWNHGAMDGFVAVNGAKAMGYYDQSDLPFYYDLANKFAVADRYFSSALTQTFPNRFFLYAGTAFGHIKNDKPTPVFGFSQPTIFDRLNDHGISWKYYKNGVGYIHLFQPLFLRNMDKVAGIEQFARDLQDNKLPQVVFVDAAFEDKQDEHPNSNIQAGQLFVAQRLKELAGSSAWRDSVVFMTYDEGGGFFDHVAPPEACVPDAIEPDLKSVKEPGRFDRYGVRVPFVAISPFAKHHFVSHEVYDHSSILKFIETKFNLPALTARDANANGLLGVFDFAHPDFETKPDFSLATVRGHCPN